MTILSIEFWFLICAAVLAGVGLSILFFKRKSFPFPPSNTAPGHTVSDHELLAAVERCDIGYVHIDRTGRIISVNAAMGAITERDSDALVGREITSLFVDHERPDSGHFITDIVFTPPFDRTHSYALTALGANGRRSPVEIWFAGAVSPANGETQWLIRDVSVAQELERLRLSEERYKSSQSFADIGTWDWVVRTDELHWSPEVAPMFGLAPGSSFSYAQFCAAVHPDDRARVKENEDACIASDQKHDVEYRVVWSDGTERWLRETGNLLRDEDGKPVRMIGIVRDITDQKEAEQRFRHMAYHDPLTGLPNRGLFEQRLDMALQRASRHQSSVALLFMDLGKFKSINDSYGHVVGDEVLIEVGSRLKKTVRGTDTVARIGGDEFVLIVEAVQNREEADKLAQKVIATLNEAMTIGDHDITIDVSIGISLCDNTTTTPQELIHQADMAMYAAKTAGQNQIRTA